MRRLILRLVLLVYVLLLLFLARAWCTIPTADLLWVWCAGFRRCLFSLYPVIKASFCGFATEEVGVHRTQAPPGPG